MKSLLFLLLLLAMLSIFEFNNTNCKKTNDADLVSELNDVLVGIQPEMFYSISNETRILLVQSKCSDYDMPSSSHVAIDFLANALSVRTGNRPMVRIKKPTIVYETKGNTIMPFFVPSHISIRFGKHERYGYVLIFHPDYHLYSLPSGVTNIYDNIYFSPHKY